ncbi:flagellar protein FliT [Herbaspirillum sp. RTI4]|uniref:flagellar protein FliT n=1 Tax=Herbaspirillum sp. RTI4 TaxID=3048640 RepID=UPI002AB412D5|nr:flagellar protein FliT [Herbaspirillum sp. RTI4]MDY7578324.1 flagellar protein FliT [Herbaspirillum sp. RTI4]MEA9981183.1 flagellar protein FliT [Herbaspirillum sp. RTI4]
MNSEEAISLYESIATVTDQMLAAARSSDWQLLSSLEAQCAQYVDRLRANESAVPLEQAARERKITIIKKILADDKDIRSLTEPWLNHLASMAKSTGNERKLVQTYGMSPNSRA